MKKLHIYKCHVDLIEAISPIYYENKLLGYLMMGQVLGEKPNNILWEKMSKYCKDYQVDFRQLKESFFNLKYLEKERIEAAARVMDRSAKYIHLANIVKIQQLPIIEKIDYFINTNLSQDINITELAVFLNYSNSHLSHVFNKELNTFFTNYLREKRIDKAKELLIETNLAIKTIGEKVGYSDPNYFSRVFKKTIGISPTIFRDKSIK